MLASLHAAPTPEQISVALGSPPELTWTISSTPDSPGWWGNEYGIRLGQASAGSVHSIETTVNGPGVIGLRIFQYQGYFDTTVWIDGVQSGTGVQGGTNQLKAAVGTGTHVIRWQATRTAQVPGGGSTLLELRGLSWEPYSTLPLATGAAGNAVVLTSTGTDPWIGQDRWHHGDGGAAWSGLKDGPPAAGAVNTPLRATFQGPGVLSFWHQATRDSRASYRIDGGTEQFLDAYEWKRTRRMVGPGTHAVEWRAGFTTGNSSRVTCDLAVDEISLLPIVPFDVALETPGLTWTAVASPGSTAESYGIHDATASGGSLVVNGGYNGIKTAVTGPCLMKIRGRQYPPSVYFASTYLGSPTVLPGSLPDGWHDWVWVIPAGTGELQLSGGSGSEFDRVQFVQPPANLATAIGLPAGSFTTGGGSPWSLAPYPEITGHGARTEVPRGGAESWLDLPVTGPAEIGFSWKVGSYFDEFALLVDGEEFDSTNGFMESGEVRIEVPAGHHTLRWVVRSPGPSAFANSVGTLGPVSITPVPPGESAVRTLGLAGSAAFWGDWSVSSGLNREGRMTLQAPPEDPALPFRPAKVKARFTGPGEVSFWYYAEAPAPGNTTARWRLTARQPGTPQLYWEGDAYTQGWLEGSLWLPPGDHLCEWSVDDAKEHTYRAALDDIEFTPSRTVTLEQATAGLGLRWDNDAAHPWRGLAIGNDPSPEIISPDLLSEESARLSTVVKGPGKISFLWKNHGHDSVTGTFLVNGELHHSTDWHWESARVEFLIPTVSTTTLEWLATTESGKEQPGSYVAVDDLKWEPWRVHKLAPSLDAPSSVAWSTSAGKPFTGRDDAGAQGGTSAYIALLPGEESWLEATVKGPGIFDFWLREAAGVDLSYSIWDYWSLTIDGQPVAIGGTTWPAQWITGEGSHRIRLTFRHPEGSDREWVAAAVDQVSWQPLKRTGLTKAGGLARQKWRTGGKSPAGGFTTGGREGKPGLVLDTLADGASWAETTVEGPCELIWDSSLSENWTANRSPRNTLEIDGSPIPQDNHPWQRMRVSLPAGSHVVRWQCDPWFDPADDEPRAFNALWRISGLTLRRGLSPLAEALDAPELFALESGDLAGSLVNVAGGDAWQPDSSATLWFFAPRQTGTMNVRWGRPDAPSSRWRYEDEEGYSGYLESSGPGWQTFTALLRLGGFSRWNCDSGSSGDSQPPLLDGLSMDLATALALDAATESPQPWTGEGWTGRAESDAVVEGDAAWSFLSRDGDDSYAEATLTGPARLSFWWKRRGTGSLGVSVDGGLVPVPLPGDEWSQVELDINPGEHVVRWSHEAAPNTNGSTPAEAWVDGCSLQTSAPRTMAQAAVLDPAITLAATGDVPLSWHPVAHAEADGTWTEAVRAVSGSRLLRTTVTGPAVLVFRSRCFSGQPADTRGNLRARSVIIIGGGGSQPEVLGHFLAAQVDGSTVLRTDESAAGAWQDSAIDIPDGTHEITFRLTTRQRSWFGESEIDAVKPDLQGWLDDLRLLSLSAHFAEWAATHRLPTTAGDADGDGASNELEYWFGTEPGDRNSRPPALELAQRVGSRGGSDGLQLQIPYLPSHTSRALESSSDLENWQPDPAPLLHYPPPSSWIVGSEGHTSSYHVVRVSTGESRKYYRLRFPSIAPESGN